MSNLCCPTITGCRNLLFEKDKYYCRFADSVYGEFHKIKYGIASCKTYDNLMIDSVRKDIVDYQANDDGDALTEVGINHMGWLPVYFPTNDTSCEYQSPWSTQKFCVQRACSGPKTIGLNYNAGSISGNLIEVNAGGCITRINVNPSITINNCGSSYVYTQACNDPQTVWTITHNLGYVPNAWTIDCDGDNISGTLVVLNNNVITITFSTAQAGTAYLT